MGCFTYSVEIGDWYAERFERVEALVDTGSSYTIVPTSLLTRLGIAPSGRRSFFLADGSTVMRDTASANIRIDERESPTVVVFGDEDSAPLLGAHALEGLGLGVDAVNKRLIDTPSLRL